jgi:SAM-dependent methyltransferase
MQRELYSLENAQKFNWSSVSGNLNPERISHLETYLVGKKILDAGCGGGAYVEYLSQKGLEVTGVDKYDQFLEVARQKGHKGTYVQGDITNLPFPDKSFDCTYCFDVLEHVDDVVALKELVRVTEKRLIFTVPQKDEFLQKFGLLPYPYLDPTHLRYYTKDSIKELVSIVGYSNLQIFTEGMIPFHFLFKEVLTDKKVKSKSWILRDSYRIKSSNIPLNKFIAKTTDFLLNLVLNFDRLDLILGAYFNDPEFYKQINQGLVAVVDL